jgi:hypothetical protein
MKTEKNSVSSGARETTTIAIFDLPVLTENINEWIEDFERMGGIIVREYSKSDKPHFLGKVTIGGEYFGYFGFVVWSKDGEDLTVTPILENNENKLFVMLWEEFVRCFILNLLSGCKSDYYYHANSKDEAVRAMMEALKQYNEEDK